MLEFKVLNEKETEEVLIKVAELLNVAIEEISTKVEMNSHSLMLFLFYTLASDIGRYDRKNMKQWLLTMGEVQDALEKEDDEELERLSNILNNLQGNIIQNIALVVRDPEGTA